LGAPFEGGYGYLELIQEFFEGVGKSAHGAFVEHKIRKSKDFI
jgi:hypothetical protein